SMSRAAQTPLHQRGEHADVATQEVRLRAQRAVDRGDRTAVLDRGSPERPLDGGDPDLPALRLQEAHVLAELASPPPRLRALDPAAVEHPVTPEEIRITEPSRKEPARWKTGPDVFCSGSASGLQVPPGITRCVSPTRRSGWTGRCR